MQLNFRIKLIILFESIYKYPKLFYQFLLKATEIHFSFLKLSLQASWNQFSQMKIKLLISKILQFIQQSISQFMENKQIFYKIGKIPSNSSFNFQTKQDSQYPSPEPQSGIQINLKHFPKHEVLKHTTSQDVNYIKELIEQHPQLQKSRRKVKKGKNSKENPTKIEDPLIERHRNYDVPDMQRILKIRDTIKLFQQKATLNSVLRSPVVYSPFENIFSQQNSYFFETIKLQFNQNLVHAIYIAKIIFFTLYMFIFPLTLLYDHLSHSQFVLGIKLCGIMFNSFDFGETLLKDYAVDNNYALNREKYMHFIKEKRMKMIYEFLILLSTILSLVIADHPYGSILFLTVSFNISHFVEQLHKLEDQFITVTYLHKYWNLFKVIMKNIFVCHLLACTLIAIAYINKQSNWMKPNSIDQLLWYEQYIWSYYFGITIILTIGFGDFHANNTAQALFIIVISFCACVFFGFNINYIGNLINSIKQEQNEKNTKLKLLNSLSKKSKVSKSVYNEISRYIIEESKIKQESNYNEQKKLLKELPESLRSSFLQQANEKLFNHLQRLIPLSNTAIQRLSLKIEARFCHPDQLIKGPQSQSSIIILQLGEIGYITRSKYPSKLKNAIIQRISNKVQSQSKLVCVDILLKDQLNYDIKSLDYSIIYEMDKSNFQESIISSQKDYQLYREILDKCRYKLNEFALVRCRFCPNKLHTLFQCPKVHFQPFRKTLPLKFAKQHSSKQPRVCFKRNKKLLQCQVIVQTKICHSYQSQIQNPNISSQVAKTLNGQGQTLRKDRLLNKTLRPSNENMYLTMQMVTQLRNDIKNLKSSSIDSFQFTLWGSTDCDEAFNFKYYFSKWNPDYIGAKEIKNTLMARTNRLKRKPKMVISI